MSSNLKLVTTFRGEDQLQKRRYLETAGDRPGFQGNVIPRHVMDLELLITRVKPEVPVPVPVPVPVSDLRHLARMRRAC